MSRVVVVGGGFGGTAAAARLAKQGHDVTLLERRDRLGGAVGSVERDGFRWDAGPTSTALPAVVRDLFRKSGRPLERELELVPRAADARAPLRRRHRARRCPRAAAPRSSRPSTRRSGPGLGEQWVDYVHGFAETWDVLRRAYLERPWSPDHVDRAHEGAAAHPRAALHTGRDQHARATSGCGRSRCCPPGWTARTRAACPPGWACGPTSSRASASGRCPAALGALAEAMTRRLAERRVRVLLGTTARDLRLRERPGGRRRHRPGAAWTPTSWSARSTPAASRRSRRTSRRTMPADPPAVHHLGLRGDRARPAARGGAARRPHAGGAHRRHRSRRRRRVDGPGPRPARRGRRSTCWPRAGSTYAAGSRCGWTARRASRSRRWAGRRTACGGRAGASVRARLRTPPVRRGVRRRGARRGRGGAAVRRAGRRRGRRADRARPERSGSGHRRAQTRRRSRASPWSGSACRSAAPARRRRAARRTSRWRSRCPRRARRPGRPRSARPARRPRRGSRGRTARSSGGSAAGW